MKKGDLSDPLDLRFLTTKTLSPASFLCLLPCFLPCLCYKQGMNEQTKRAIEQARTVPAVARKERSTQDVEKCAAHVLSALANLGGASRSDLLRAFRWMRADEFNGACRLLLDEGLITVYKAKIGRAHV